MHEFEYADVTEVGVSAGVEIVTSRPETGPLLVVFAQRNVLSLFRRFALPSGSRLHPLRSFLERPIAPGIATVAKFTPRCVTWITVFLSVPRDTMHEELKPGTGVEAVATPDDAAGESR